jgi:hypothetical protein
VVVTPGFRGDPHLDLLEESAWHLSIELDPDEALAQTTLTAHSFSGWTTVFQPPWPFGPEDSEIRPAWRVLQWRETPEGDHTDRALRQADIEELVDLVPSRFSDWIVEVTDEALNAIDAIAPELELNEGKAIVTDLPQLKARLERTQRHQADRRSAPAGRYGDVFLYDFPSNVDLRWQIEPMAGGREALTVEPADDGEPHGRLALVPPSEQLPWRWTDPDRPDEGGFVLSPADAMARVPREFHGWVAARTFEALQHARTRLSALARGALADPADLGELAQLARRAQELAAGGRELGISRLRVEDMPDEAELVGETRSPDGRVVMLYASTWSHIVAYHPEMEACLEDVLRTVEAPEVRRPDPRPGRERMFSRGGPQTWLRVIVEFAGPVDRVVTAFPQTNNPEGWDNR